MIAIKPGRVRRAIVLKVNDRKDIASGHVLSRGIFGRVHILNVRIGC
jgi:hypothetical protein